MKDLKDFDHRQQYVLGQVLYCSMCTYCHNYCHTPHLDVRYQWEETHKEYCNMRTKSLYVQKVGA